MKQIVLDSVCIENFRSFTAPAVIQFTRTNGLKFIAGDNRVEPALGANGAGKSTVFDAVCYALYGQSIKGLRASELRSYGAKSTAVLVLLLIDGETFWVQRTSAPERLTINDRPATQKEVDQLVGLSCDRFLNSVVYGQAVPLFVDLGKPARGDLLDQVLNLEFWIKAADKATARHSQQAVELDKIRMLTAQLEGRLNAQPDLTELKAKEDAWKAERDGRLTTLIERYEAVEDEIRQLQEQVKEVDWQPLTEAKSAFDNAMALVTEAKEHHTVLRTLLNRIEEDIAFFNIHDTCPTCGQNITKEFCNEHLDDLGAKKARYDDEVVGTVEKIRTATAAATDLGDTADKIRRDLTNTERASAVIAEQIRGKRQQSVDLQQQATRAKNEKNPYTEQRKHAVAERKRLTSEIDRQHQVEEIAARWLTTVNYWRQGFRRVREYCLENVLRELQLETRNSLLVLGLHDWNVAFTTAVPTQRGTYRFGVEVQIEPPKQPAGSFDILSGGEGQRARLAVSLGLGSLIQRWSGIKWNFEVFDEPTAWLSERGVEDLLDCLAYRATAQDKSVYICDHRALAHSGFAENYMVVKDAGGSHWERV